MKFLIYIFLLIIYHNSYSYEREDIGKANGGDNYIFHMPKLIEPVGESKNDYTIFSELSQKLGFHKEFTNVHEIYKRI